MIRIKYLITFLIALATVATTAQKKVDNSILVDRLYFSRFLNNKTLAFGGPDSLIHFVQLSKLRIGKLLLGFRGAPDGVEFTKNGKQAVATSVDNEIGVWDIPSGKMKIRLGEFFRGYYTAKSIQILPDQKAFSVFQNCDFPIFNSTNGIVLDTIKAIAGECAYGIVYSASGDKVIGIGNSTIWRYNIKKKSVEEVAKYEKLSVYTDIATTSDEKTIAVGGRQGLLLLRADLSEKAQLVGHTDWINDVEFSPDGKLLASCSGTNFGTDQTVRLWDIESGKSIVVFEGHTNNVNALNFSPNGKLVASASNDGTIKLWSILDKKLICSIAPVWVNKKLVPFFFTPSGLYYGPSEYFRADSIANKSSLSEKARKSAINSELKKYLR